MKRERLQKEWHGLSEEIMDGIAQWRVVHPKATMREIEAEIDKRLSELRAKMISDTANQSVRAAWEGAEGVVCPACGAKLEKKGKKKRILLTRDGREIELVRDYGVCVACGQGIFPLAKREELELLPGKLTPCGHECLVRLAGWIPSFEKAAELLGDFLGMEVSKIMAQNYTEEAGAAYEQMQKEEVEALERNMPEAATGAEKMQISADGAMIPLLHGLWAEVRTLVIGDVQPAVQEKGEWVVHTRNLSYFSRKVSAQEFQRLALVEMHRRGVEKAKQVAAVMDGADWEQGFVDFHCPGAIRILDFAHAAEHVNEIGEFLHGEHTPKSQVWLKECLHRLKHEGPDKLLRELQKLQRKHPQAQAISGNLAYLKKRTSQMQYPHFQAQGWPIGSGMVESGNKLVVHARLKGAGMHWAEEHVNPMLALRNILCSDRWQQDWPKIEARLRKQTNQRRSTLHHVHHPAPPISLVARALQGDFGPTLPQQPVQDPPPPKKNPWRNFKHGKALFERPTSPKI